MLGSDSTGHIDSRTILPVGGGYDQEVVNAAGQTSAIVSHGADGSGIVQAFTASAGGVTTMTSQALYSTSGIETALSLVNADGSRSEATLDAAGHVRQVSIFKPDGQGTLTLASQATYDATGIETSVTSVNADGTRKLAEFDAQGQVRKVSLERADGSVTASFILEAGNGVTAGTALLNGVAFALAEEIEAQPADDKHTVSKRVTLPDGELYAVTMDASGKIVYEHVHTGDGILGFIEQAVGVVLNVLAFVPGVNVVAAPLAVAWDLGQAGKDFANGNYLGGVLGVCQRSCRTGFVTACAYLGSVIAAPRLPGGRCRARD